MNSRERFLLSCPFLLVLGGGLFFATEKFAVWEKKLHKEAHQIQLQEKEATLLLAEQERWQKRRAWLEEKQPMRSSQGLNDSAFLRLVKDTADQKKLAILQAKLLEPEERDKMVSSSINVQLRANLPQILQWIYEFQTPEAFIEIPALRLEPDPEKPAFVTANLIVRKWFRTN
jgi:hypothetical protein